MVNQLFKKRVLKSKSQKAGLIFPVSRFHRYLKKQFPTSCRFKISIGAAVYAASVLEYLVAEIAEQAGNAARVLKMKRINPRHIMLAISQDMEMNQTLKHVILPSTGRPLNLPVQPTTRNTRSTATKKLPVKQQPPVKKASKAPKKRPVNKKSMMKVLKKTTKVARKIKSKIKKSQAKKSKKVELLNERTLFLGQKLVVVQGDIVNVSADAVVHPTSSGYDFGGQVGHALVSKGGSDLEAAVSKTRATKPSIKICEAIVSEAANIPFKHIIHVNSPSWSNNHNTGVANLEKAITNILDAADTNGIQTIAVPSISSGGGGYPKQVAAETILRTINSYFAGIPKSGIRQIYFVIYDKETLEVYKSELTRLA